MIAGEKMFPSSFSEALIAPCGMNCALCMRYLRQDNRCLGCNGGDDAKSRTCAACSIKACDERTGDYCFQCSTFPCPRLRRLDARYRAKYGMSMLSNLGCIREGGLVALLALERDRWECVGCGGVTCVHTERCIYCGRLKEQIAPA